MMMINADMNDLLNMNSGSSSNSNSSNSSFGIQRFDVSDVHLDSQDHHDEQHNSLSLDQSDSQQERQFKIQEHNHQQAQQQQQQLISQQISIQQQQQQQQLNIQQQLQGPNQQQQQSQDSKPKRNPYCSRCRNHGKSAQVKGHKRHCEYRDCQCEGCKLVECRQIVSAAQIKRRRYQKQDEECGRRIEISPPVLTREPNSDPAALIAKTLIGSASAKHALQHSAMAAQKQLTASPHQQQHHHHHQLHPHLPSIHSAAAAATLAAAAAASSASSSANPASNQHHHHNRSSSNNNNHQQQLHGAHLNLNLNMNHHNPHQAPKGAVDSSPGSSALSNALHLFHFPNSVLSAAAAASIGSHTHSSSVIGATGQPTVVSTANSSPLPSIREQITLVEEIHQAYGPLAIYAWLRAEQFDLQKVRDLIELSRVSFDELLQITGHSPLDLTSPIVD